MRIQSAVYMCHFCNNKVGGGGNGRFLGAGYHVWILWTTWNPSVLNGIKSNVYFIGLVRFPSSTVCIVSFSSKIFQIFMLKFEFEWRIHEEEGNLLWTMLFSCLTRDSFTNYLHTWILRWLVITDCADLSKHNLHFLLSFAGAAIVVPWSPEVDLGKVCLIFSPP